jgi:hypothetical protein
LDRSAIDELFERNADMRLLELRHSETGRTSGAVRHVAGGFGAETSVGEADVRIANAPRMRVAIAAVPKSGVIPGALVSVVIDVFNDGTAPAPESKLVLSLPIETEFRTGTLRIDGREVIGPERLFGDGLPIARLPGDTSAKVVLQIHVLPGLNPLYLQPRLQTNGVPVVGTPGISIKRAAAPGTRTAAEPERPFYELDDEEVASVEAVTALPIVPPVLPPVDHVAIVAEPATEPEPAAPPPPKRARRQAAAKPAVEPPPADVVPVDAALDVPAAAEAPAPKTPRAIAPAEARMSRFRTLGKAEVAVLDRLFLAEQPGIVAHLIAISTIACTEPEHDADTSGYGDFVRADLKSLGRALVLTRLGKPLDVRIEQSALGALLLPWEPTAPPTTTPRRSPRRLRRDLSETECRAVGGLVQPSKRDPNLRLRIALLALAGATIEGVARSRADECVNALASYRSAVLAWLIPLCVASMTANETTVPHPPANVDAAGRRLAIALRAAYAD